MQFRAHNDAVLAPVKLFLETLQHLTVFPWSHKLQIASDWLRRSAVDHLQVPLQDPAGVHPFEVNCVRSLDFGIQRFRFVVGAANVEEMVCPGRCRKDVVAEVHAELGLLHQKHAAEFEGAFAAVLVQVPCDTVQVSNSLN